MRNGTSNPFGKHGKLGLGPVGGSNNPIPSNNELRWCAWGFLMASVWFADPGRKPPSKKFIEALAELRGLKVPAMAEAGEYFVDEVKPQDEEEENAHH